MHISKLSSNCKYFVRFVVLNLNLKVNLSLNLKHKRLILLIRYKMFQSIYESSQISENVVDLLLVVFNEYY